MTERTETNVGGYEDGYRACPCFWGRAPGSLVARLCARAPHWTGRRVLDAGCGEGKNAIYFARLGARVLAVDLCETALRNAQAAWDDASLVEWARADVRTMPLQAGGFAAVLAYGLLHCLAGEREIIEAVGRLQAATAVGGYHLLCAFNDRHQELTAHPGFMPILLRHRQYLDLYRDWKLEYASDADLHESHPHNGIPHVHSLTRVLARKEVEP